MAGVVTTNCFSGKDGRMHYDDLPIGRVRSWTLQSSMETMERTSLGETARTYCAGLKSATGSATVWYHNTNDVHTVLDNTITKKRPTAAKLELFWADKKIAFMAYVTSAVISCSTGEVMSVELSFQMTDDYLSTNFS